MITPPTLLPETMAQCRRVIADGGTIIDQKFMDRVIRTMKAQGAYSSCKFLADANFAVKKDGSGAVSTLYDISGNNNDAVQATGANQPIWTAAQQNGKAALVYDSGTHLLSVPGVTGIQATDYTILAVNYGVDRAVTGSTIFSIGSSDGNHESTLFVFPGTGVMWFRQYEGGYTTVSGITSVLNAWKTITATKSGTTGTIFLNGTQDATGTSANITLATQGWIGKRVGNTQYYSGKMGTVSVIAAALTTAQRQALESLINSYYAIY